MIHQGDHPTQHKAGPRRGGGAPRAIVVPSIHPSNQFVRTLSFHATPRTHAKVVYRKAKWSLSMYFCRNVPVAASKRRMRLSGETLTSSSPSGECCHILSLLLEGGDELGAPGTGIGGVRGGGVRGVRGGREGGPGPCKTMTGGRAQMATPAACIFREVDGPSWPSRRLAHHGDSPTNGGRHAMRTAHPP